MAPNLSNQTVDFMTAVRVLQDKLSGLPPAPPVKDYSEIEALVIGMNNYYWMRGFNTSTCRFLRLKLLSIVTRREITTTYDLSSDEAKIIRRFLFSGVNLTPEGMAIFSGVESIAQVVRV